MNSVLHLRNITDDFLVSELPTAFRVIGSPPYEVSVGCELRLEDVTDTKVAIGFYRGSHLANYRISSLGSVLDLNVMLNVRKLVVSYKLPLEYGADNPAVSNCFLFATEGAKHTGFDVHWLDQRVPGQAPVTELRALIKMDKGFLGDAEERLFMANDVALMTRSVIRCWQRFQLESCATETV